MVTNLCEEKCSFITLLIWNYILAPTGVTSAEDYWAGDYLLPSAHAASLLRIIKIVKMTVKIRSGNKANNNTHMTTACQCDKRKTEQIRLTLYSYTYILMLRIVFFLYNISLSHTHTGSDCVHTNQLLQGLLRHCDHQHWLLAVCARLAAKEWTGGWW